MARAVAGGGEEDIWVMGGSSTGLAEVVGVFVLYGLFYALEDSQSKAFIADLEHDRRASAVGIYSFLTGLLYVPASLVAGALWAWSPQMAFGLGALLAVLAMVVFGVVRPART